MQKNGEEPGYEAKQTFVHIMHGEEPGYEARFAYHAVAFHTVPDLGRDHVLQTPLLLLQSPHHWVVGILCVCVCV